MADCLIVGVVRMSRVSRTEPPLEMKATSSFPRMRCSSSSQVEDVEDGAAVGVEGDVLLHKDAVLVELQVAAAEELAPCTDL